jgi:hypothetical protein
VLVFCFVERKEFSIQIVSKLGSSFSVVPYVIVVVRLAVLLSNSSYFTFPLENQLTLFTFFLERSKC